MCYNGESDFGFDDSIAWIWAAATGAGAATGVAGAAAGAAGAAGAAVGAGVAGATSGAERHGAWPYY